MTRRQACYGRFTCMHCNYSFQIHDKVKWPMEKRAVAWWKYFCVLFSTHPSYIIRGVRWWPVHTRWWASLAAAICRWPGDPSARHLLDWPIRSECYVGISIAMTAWEKEPWRLGKYEEVYVPWIWILCHTFCCRRYFRRKLFPSFQLWRSVTWC